MIFIQYNMEILIHIWYLIFLSFSTMVFLKWEWKNVLCCHLPPVQIVKACQESYVTSLPIILSATSMRLFEQQWAALPSPSHHRVRNTHISTYSLLTHAHTHACMHSLTHTHMHLRMPPYTRTHTHAHAHTHTDTHTHTQTQWLEYCVSSAKVVGSIPRKTYILTKNV